MKYEDIAKVNGEIKTMEIHGKGYAEVAQRVQAFRKLFPEGTIETELVSITNGVCIFKATARDKDNILGTGHAYEKEGSSNINRTSYIENCETSAVGRALSFVGLGSEAGIASYEEVANAKLQQNAPAQTVPANAAGIEMATPEQLTEIRRLAKQKGRQEIELVTQAKVSKLEDMYAKTAQNCIEWLKGM